MEKHFFPNLDGLRFFAFILVFWQHAFAPIMPDLPEFYHYYFITGGLGVSFFFVLSGFLITYLLLKESDRNGFINIKSFYARRVLRILPLYYAVMIFGFVIYPLMRYALHLPPQDNGNPLYYLLFLGNFDVLYAQIDRPSFVSVLWSLAIEEQFYIFWVLLLVVIPKRFYLYLICSVILLSLIFRHFQTEQKVLYFHTLSVVGDLGIGALMAYLAIYKTRFTGWFETLSKGVIVMFYLSGFIILFLLPQFTRVHDMPAIGRLLFSLYFAFIIAEQNHSTNSFYKMSNFKWISKLGTLTYGLYLLHPIAFYFAHLVTGNIMLTALLALLLSLILSFTSFYGFEKPILGLKKRFAV